MVIGYDQVRFRCRCGHELDRIVDHGQAVTLPCGRCGSAWELGRVVLVDRVRVLARLGVGQLRVPGDFATPQPWRADTGSAGNGRRRGDRDGNGAWNGSRQRQGDRGAAPLGTLTRAELLRARAAADPPWAWPHQPGAGAP